MTASGNSQQFPEWFAHGQQDREVFYIARTRDNAKAGKAAIEGNEEIFDRIMNDPAFRSLASERDAGRVRTIAERQPELTLV